MNEGTANPLVSVIMANLNGAADIAEAVRSVLRQTERSLELIVSDDGSSDGSLEIALAAANGDRRLVILKSAQLRSGPAAARNRALAVARGRWIAPVDNDDVIHPERLARLIRAAEADGADVAADDLLVFYEDGARAPHAHLRGKLARAPHWITAAEYERSNRLLSGRRALGYLKPVLRRDLKPRYDESLRIAEDADLVLRLLITGARLRVYPEIGYFYRKHAGSISHRLDLGAIDAMDAALAKLDVRSDPELVREVRASRAAIANARSFTEFVSALKAREFGVAVRIAAQKPGSLLLLRDAVVTRLPKPSVRRAAAGTPRVTLISRQRIIGATNGSSAYLLMLANALRKAGFAVDYIGPSPKIFGRWALLRLRPEVAVFDRYLVRGGVRAGNLVLATDLRLWSASLSAVLAAGLHKLGLPVDWSKPAEAAQRADATRADQLFLALHADASAAAVVCDYAFLTPLAPFALAPRAPRLVVMHDLMSARIRDPSKADAYDLSAAEEFRLLGQADTIVAIQQEEARAVRAALPKTEIVVAPFAAAITGASQPGRDNTLLFVGSNTPPNVTALERFFAESWPAIRAHKPESRLIIAGSVNRAFSAAPDGARFAGVVEDLEPLYRDAGVVISPLYSGSGLKIKLIEAMAAGKAVVGTSITTQGVERAREAMMVADDPSAFAEAVIALSSDRSRRETLGRAALRLVRECFSPETATAGFVARVLAASATRERPTALGHEADQSNEWTDEDEGERSLEAHLTDQQRG
jgi:glycosyltransferase involved in cell wall biosynthesis